jgi:hypothetical protein
LIDETKDIVSNVFDSYRCLTYSYSECSINLKIKKRYKKWGVIIKTFRIQPYFGIVLLLSILIFPSFKIYAFQNEPDGFRGIKWGTNIKDLPEMGTPTATGSDNSQFYARKDDKLKIGDADLESLSYLFYKDRFFSVFITFSSLANATAIRETSFQQYGAGHRPNRFMQRYFWTGSTMSITYDYNEVSKIGALSYFY